jgi:hypothetical protein
MRCTYIRGGVHTKDYTDGLNLLDPAVDGDFDGDGAGVEEEVAAAAGSGEATGLIASHEEQRISTMMILRPCRNLTHHALVMGLLHALVMGSLHFVAREILAMGEQSLWMFVFFSMCPTFKDRNEEGNY